MSAATDLVASVQALVVGVAAAADDPGGRVALMLALAAAPAGENVAVAAVGRRAALAEAGRAAAAYQPGSYDEAETLRTTLCGLLAAEEAVAADAGEDGVVAALRALRDAVDRDLRSRGASLSPLRTVDLIEPVGPEVLSQRLYGTAGRAEEVLAQAGDAPNPVFLTGSLKVLAR